MAKGAKGANGVELATAYLTLIPSLKGATGQIKSQLAGIDTSDAGTKLGKQLGGQIGRSLDLASVRTQLDSGGKALQDFGGKLADVGGTLTSNVTVPLAAATAGVGAFALSTASAAETTEISFTTMLGSEEKALAMMDELADFAAHTPFELSGLQDATRQLLAYGFEAEEVVPMLTAVGDATAALGTGQQGIESVTRALGQMQTRGKASAEEMLQLTEAGIPAWEYLAAAIGTDTAGAMDAVSRGAVDADTAIKALTEGMERDFGGMMEQQSQTVAGIMSNIADSIQQPLMELRNSDAYDSFAESLGKVAEAAGPFAESLLPHLEDGLQLVADGVEDAAGAMDEFASMSKEDQRQLLLLAAGAAAAGPALTLVGTGFKVVGTAMRGASTVLGAASKGLDALGAASGKASSAMAKAQPSATGLTGLLGKLGGAATVAVGGYALLTSAISDTIGYEENAAAASEAARGLGSFAEAMASVEPYQIDLQNTLSSAGNSLSDLEGRVQTSAANISAALKTSLQETGSVTPEATEEYRAQIEEMLAAAEESANTYAQTIENISARVGEATGQMGGEQLAQYVSDVDSAYSQAKEACETNLDAMLSSIEQYHTAAGTINSEAYDEDVARAREAYAQQSAAIDEAYSGQLALTGQYAQGISDEQSALWAELADQADAFSDDWHVFWQDFSGIATALDTNAFNELRAKMTDGYTAAWMAAQVATVEGGGQLDEAARENLVNFLRVFDGLPTELQDEGTESMRALAESIEASGVELGDVSNMSGQQIVDALAEKLGLADDLLAASGDGVEGYADKVAGSMAEAGAAVGAYNGIPVLDKDGTVLLDDAQLVDAQGNVYTWNGSYLADQNGTAAVQDQELVDAQGNLYTWNGSSLVPHSASADIWGNLGTALGQANAWRNLPYNLGNKIGSAVISISQNVTQTISKIFANAAGGVRLNAAGGIAPRYHAGGAIATRAVPLDIVGEDGAEAIVPLTNRRYSQPFADIIAEGVLEQMGKSGRIVNQTFNTKVVRADEDMYAVAPIIYRNATREARLMGA